MIVVSVFLSILNQMEFLSVQNRNENCHCDHIPFDLKGNGNIVFWGCVTQHLLMTHAFIDPSMWSQWWRGVKYRRYEHHLWRPRGHIVYDSQWSYMFDTLWYLVMWTHKNWFLFHGMGTNCLWFSMIIYFILCDI